MFGAPSAFYRSINASRSLVDELPGVAEGLDRFAFWDGTTGLIDEIVPFDPHPVEPGHELGKVPPKRIRAEVDDGLVLVPSFGSKAQGQHERPTGSEHGMVRDGVSPFLIDAEVGRGGQEIASGPTEIGQGLFRAEADGLDEPQGQESPEVRHQSL